MYVCMYVCMYYDHTRKLPVCVTTTETVLIIQASQLPWLYNLVDFHYLPVRCVTVSQWVDDC